MAKRFTSWKKFERFALKSNETSVRLDLREKFLEESRASIFAKFCGTGRLTGDNVWPENMPRKVRRQIERDAAKGMFRRHKQQALAAVAGI